MKPRYFIPLFFLSALLLTGLLQAKEPVVKIKKEWKFKEGDNPEYAKQNFDDSKWETLEVCKTWESQGREQLNGFAWYRIKVVIPSSLKNDSKLKDSIVIYLGKIDDYDESFLNDGLIGVNGRPVVKNTFPDSGFIKERPIPWNRERFYKLAANDPRIKWDKENTLAIRVFDQGGDGGMFYGEPFIKTPNIKDYFVIDNFSGRFFYGKDSASKTVRLINLSSRYLIEGKFTIKAKDRIKDKIIFSKSYNVKLKPAEIKEYPYVISFKEQQCGVDYKFEFSENQGSAACSDILPYILTPPAQNEPRINGAKVYGQRPGKPFLYTIAASGARPMTFDAEGLPKGLTIDKSTGIISGKVDDKGEYTVILSAFNQYGKAKSRVKFSIGGKIALTPPMGWNSWNAWGLAVDQEKVIASAKVFKEKGLMNHGWTYINIDDGWEIEGSQPGPKRDAEGNILCNSKFPDMKALGDSIHALGLKFGIYSSPGPLTCGGYTASYLHEINDAKSYAAWGIDYLKYDWCSYDKIATDHSLPELKKPYYIMNDALKSAGRDIVYSLCQYGMGSVWEWGDSVGGQLWRTTGDIVDTWESMSKIGFGQDKNAPYAKPGNWNDPDMLVVGWVGWGPSLRPTALTPDEQYTHISLWCLLSAPLLIGCDLTRLDDFTLNLLTNDEALALDQDPLGKQAVQKISKKNIRVWVKELEDGNTAVGIFNLGPKREKFSLSFSEIGVRPEAAIRDLWRQKDLGMFNGKFETAVEGHGVRLLKITR
jgi:hypothetical protein